MVLTNSVVSSATLAVMSSWTQDDWANFTSVMAPLLPNNLVSAIPLAYIPHIGPNSLAAFPLASIQEFTQAQISLFITLQLQALTLVTSGAAKITDLSAAQFGYFTSVQIPSFHDEVFSILSISEINNFASTVLRSLSNFQFAQFGKDQIDGLFSTNNRYTDIVVDRMRVLTSDQMGYLGTNILLLSNAQLAAILYTSFSSISTANLGSFSTAQVENITDAQFADLSAAQMSALGTKIANVKPSAIAGVTAGANTKLKDLTAGVFANLVEAQINAIKFQAAIQALTFTNAQYKSMDAIRLAWLSQAQIAGLDNSVITDLTAVTSGTAKVQSLTADQFGYFVSGQIPLFKKEVFAILSIAEINNFDSGVLSALSTDQFAQFGQDQFDGLFDSNGIITDIAVARMGELSVAQMGYLDTSVIDLSNAQCAAIPPVVFASMTDAVLILGSFSTDQIANITDAQFAALSALQMSALGTDIASVNPSAIAAATTNGTTKLKDLTAGVFANLVEAQINVIASQNAVQALTFTNAQYKSMDAIILAWLSQAQIAGLDNSVITDLTAVDVSSGIAKVQSLTPTQFGYFVARHIAAFHKEVFAILSIAEINNFYSGVLSALSTDQFAQFGKDQIDGLFDSNSRFTDIAVARMGELTVAQMVFVGNNVTKFSGAQLAALKPAVFATISDANLTTITTAHGDSITQDQIDALSAAQINNGIQDASKLKQSPVPVKFSTAQINTGSLNVAALQSLTMAQIRAYSIEDVFAKLDPTNIKYLNKAQCALVRSNTTLLAGSPPDNVDQLNRNILSRTPTEIAQLNQYGSAYEPYQLSLLSSAQTAALSSSALNSFSADKFNAVIVTDLTTTQIASIDSAIFTFEQLSKLTATQTKAIPVSVLNVFTPAQFNAVNVGDLSTGQIAGLSAAVYTAVQLSKLSALQTQSIPVSVINAFSQAQFNAVNVGDLSTDKVPSIKVSLFTTPGFIRTSSLTDQQGAVLTADQIAAITTDSVTVAAMTASFVTAMLNGASTSSVKNIGSAKKESFGAQFNNADKLTSVQLHVLTPDQFAQFSSTSVSKVNAALFDQIDYGCFKEKFVQDGSITAAQALQMSAAQVDALTGKSNPAALAAATAQVLLNTKMTNIALNYYSSINASAFGTIAANTPSSTSFTNAIGITLAIAAKLTYPQIGQISYAQFAIIPPASIPGLNPAGFGTLQTGVMGAITPAQAQEMLADQFNAAGLSAIKLTNAVLSVLILAQVMGFTMQALRNLTVTQKAYFGLDADAIVAALLDQNVSAMDINVPSLVFNEINTSIISLANQVGYIPLTADIQVTVEIPASSVHNMFKYRFSSTVSGEIDLRLFADQLAVRYEYASTSSVNVSKSTANTGAGFKTIHTYPNVKWQGKTSQAKIQTITGEIGLPADWELALAQVSELFTTWNSYTLISPSPETYVTDVSSKINNSINDDWATAVSKYNPNTAGANKFLDASDSKYYNKLNRSVVTDREDLLSYVFETLFRQPQRFVSGVNEGIWYSYPFILGDTLNFKYVCNTNAGQPRPNPTSAVYSRSYLVKMIVTV